MEVSSSSSGVSEGGVEELKLRAGPRRRNLFGPVDHHQLQLDFQRLLCVSVQAANQRWDFDFQSDRPARDSSSSAMTWEAVRCQDVPAFYRSCVATRRVSGTRAPGRRATPSSGCSSSGGSGGSGDELPEETGSVHYRLKHPTKRRQASITDFYKVKRRRLLHYKGPSRH